MASPIYVALDVETTGLSPERDAIIEIGMVKFDERRVIDRYRSFVNPGRRIPFQITQLTGISPDDVKDAPVIQKLLPLIRDFLGGHIIIGHNVGFDMGFMAGAGLRLSNRTVDTFALANVVLLHVGRHNLGTLAAEMGIKQTSAHRALDDADVTRQLFLALCERAEQLPLPIIQEINRAAQGSHWALAPLFHSFEQNRARSAFNSSIGAQLQEKGIAAGGKLGFLVRDEEGPELTPQPDKASTDIEAMVSLLQPAGAIARQFAGYEHRPQQVSMLRAVAEAMRDHRHLLVEAGTGTGKSLAYLIPTAHMAVANGQRVVISTNTINLQDQLYQKDVPDLQKALPFEFRATVLKGRSNYVCLRKLSALQAMGALAAGDMQALAQIMVWAQSTTTGDRAELFLPSADDRFFWSRVAADSESCLGEGCRYASKQCFLQRARRRSDSAHLIIANHSLLLADVATENAILPEYHYLVIDEAHHLEEATTKQLSFEATQDGIETELAQLSGAAQRGRSGGLISQIVAAVGPKLAPTERRELDSISIEIAQDANDIRDVFRSFLSDLAAFTRDNSEGDGEYGLRLRVTDSARVQPAWSRIEIAWDNLSARLGDFGRRLLRVQEALTRLEETTSFTLAPELARDLMARMAFWNGLQIEIGSIISKPGANRIDWIELAGGDGAVSLHSAPLHVGELVKKHLLDRCDSVILTSATLRAGPDFSFMRGRLSADGARELAVGSPFDYKASTLIYYPTDIPEPSTPNYQSGVSQAVANVVRALRGRTLVLFTSYRQLRATAGAISGALGDAGITVLEQGNGPSRGQLLQQFRDGKPAVLFGTRSFWEGVDVVGPALSCVIIVRIPFAVPSEPIFAARSETFDNPFSDYSVPDAVLRFRQGFGRLIRTKSDRGAVVVLDRRILAKSYGEVFQRSLPPCTVERAPMADIGESLRRWIDG